MHKKYSVRGSAWNYGGGNWKLSRSKIDLFTECKRCFYLDNKLGVKRPSMPPFNLNVAVDSLLKQEFDLHRARKSPHPLMSSYGLSAVPAQHPQINEWRENFKGITYRHPVTHFVVSGAIDDLWLLDTGEYAVVDYKATAKAEEITELNDTWHDGYRRQMEVYQWLLRRQGMKVSNTGYFVYCNGKADARAFDGRLEFDIRLIPYTGNDAWVEPILLDIHRTLTSETVPASHPDCEFCGYRTVAGKMLQKLHVAIPENVSASKIVTPKKVARRKATPNAEVKTLF